MTTETYFWHWDLDGLARQARKGDFESYLAVRLPLACPRGDVLCQSEPAVLAELIPSLLVVARRRKPALARLLIASAMLEGPAAPAWNVLQATLGGFDLGILRSGRWRMVGVPCVQGDYPVCVQLLCGYFPNEAAAEPERFALAGIDLFPSVPWAEPALRVAETKWGGRMLCRSWSNDVLLAGTSLGLPVVLALGCAATDQPLPKGILATGAVDALGRVTSVRGVDVKGCLVRGQGLLAPGENWHALGPEQKIRTIPVVDVDRAWAFWEACIQGLSAARIFSLLSALDRPADLFPLLIEAVLPELWIITATENQNRLLTALRTAANPASGLRPLLAAIVDSKKPAHAPVRNLLCTLFDAAQVRRVAATDPAVAWRLCMVHIRACNHSGQPGLAQQWLDLSQPWSRELKDEDISEELISHALSVVGLLHNTFHFQEDPLRMLGPTFQALYEQVHVGHERRRRLGGPRTNHALGAWSGTLAQHQAFRREWALAESHLDTALEYFEGDGENIAQDLCYRFFIRLDAQRADVQHDLLRFLGRGRLDAEIWDALRGLPPSRRPWALHALTRFLSSCPAHRDQAVLSCLPALFQELESQGTLLGLEPVHHPWQLILYNLGLLADASRLQANLWNRCVRLCLHSGFGPTIQVMALLPFAALHKHGHNLHPTASDQVEQIRSTIRATLNTNHFAPILSAPDWSTALERTSNLQEEIFPFNYR